MFLTRQLRHLLPTTQIPALAVPTRTLSSRLVSQRKLLLGNKKVVIMDQPLISLSPVCFTKEFEICWLLAF